MKEKWMDIDGYIGYYQVSNFGRIRSLNRKVFYKNGRVCNHKGQIIVTRVTRNGYVQVELNKNNKKKFLVHRLVFSSFEGKIPKGLEINHKDCNKQNNYLSNLECVTKEQNKIHAIENGRTTYGINNGSSILNNEQVIKIIELCKTKKPREISKIYKVHIGTIYNIKSGRNWSHLTGIK